MAAGARVQLVGVMMPGEHAIGLLSRRPPPSSCRANRKYISLFTFSSTVTSGINCDCRILSKAIGIHLYKIIRTQDKQRRGCFNTQAYSAGFYRCRLTKSD